MPPAAPDPTIAKSTVSLGEKRAAGRDSWCLYHCLRVRCRQLSVRVGVVEAERWLEPRLVLESEHVPAGVVAIASPRRQREHADDRVEPRRLEERRLLDVAEQFVLLRRGQRCESRRARPLARGAPIQILDAVRVSLLLSGVERRQRPVDEEDDAGVVGARSAVDRREDARRQRVDRVGLRQPSGR